MKRLKSNKTGSFVAGVFHCSSWGFLWTKKMAYDTEEKRITVNYSNIVFILLYARDHAQPYANNLWSVSIKLNEEILGLFFG